ncbi:recombinase family protein [Desulfosporosinus burensis]
MKHRDWQYVGVYTDEALTGTKDDREQIKDFSRIAVQVYIDMVITKSISRFARNTVNTKGVISPL